MIPEQRKSNDLNIAWVIKWKNDNKGKFNEIEKIIKLNWLRVDKAIIFFKSYSKIALELAINIVKQDKNIKYKINFLFIK